MKKVLFFAAVLAVASMTFVACGKKENKEAEQECNEATEQVEAAPAAVDRAEAATQAIEAAASMEEVMAVAMEYQDLSDEDFTPEQQARMQAAVAKLQ